MFKQNENVLNVNLKDIETYADNGVELAINNMAQSTKEDRVATINIDEPKIDKHGNDLVVDVHIQNKTGHRFPSGVTFRRVWVEFLVKNNNGEILWGSGQSNGAGIIFGANGKQLSTEFLNDPSVYQPHFQEICNEDEVQIYEELVKDAQGQFTSSFVHRVKHVKDNRMLPKGWVPGDVFAGNLSESDIKSPDGLQDQGQLLRQMMRSTDPDGIGDDPEYNHKPGGDSIRYRIPLDKIAGAKTVDVVLNSQAVTPAWLWERFSLANEAKKAGFDTPATDRLYYLASTLNLSEGPLKGWKFKVKTASQPIPNTPKVLNEAKRCGK